MTAANAAMASGTAALEGMLHKKPMVISYGQQADLALVKRMATVNMSPA